MGPNGVNSQTRVFKEKEDLGCHFDVIDIIAWIELLCFNKWIRQLREGGWRLTGGSVTAEVNKFNRIGKCCLKWVAVAIILYCLFARTALRLNLLQP